MYDLYHTEPRLTGYIYTRRKKCGKNCRCAKSDKHKHIAYYLQYREKTNGQWKKRSEYVPKSKVRSLRQRICRAKIGDKQRQQQLRGFTTEISRLAKHLQHTPSQTLDDLQQLREKIPEPASLAITPKQRVKVAESLVELINALERSVSLERNTALESAIASTTALHGIPLTSHHVSGK